MSISDFFPSIKDFRKTMEKMLRNIYINSNTKTTQRLEMMIAMVKHASSDTFWTTELGGKELVPILIDKCYEIKRHIPILSKEPTKHLGDIDSALKLYCCNKRVYTRFCKNKKVGKYCSFHANVQKKIIKEVSNATDKYLNKDLLGLLCSFMEL